MPKFEVNITRTITDRFIVTANDLDEAESIMLRLGLRCPEIFSSHEEVGLFLRVNHESP